MSLRCTAFLASKANRFVADTDAAVEEFFSSDFLPELAYSFLLKYVGDLGTLKRSLK